MIARNVPFYVLCFLQRFASTLIAYANVNQLITCLFHTIATMMIPSKAGFLSYLTFLRAAFSTSHLTNVRIIVDEWRSEEEEHEARSHTQFTKTIANRTKRKRNDDHSQPLIHIDRLSQTICILIAIHFHMNSC